VVGKGDLHVNVGLMTALQGGIVQPVVQVYATATASSVPMQVEVVQVHKA
jgi:hypothetical protein